MPPARSGAGRAGTLPSCPVQACRRPASRPPPAPAAASACGEALRAASASDPRRLPSAPLGLPHEPPGHRRTRASQRDRLGPPALYLVAAPYPARPRFARTRPERGLAQALLCLRDAPDDHCAATGPSLRQAVLSCCPVPADFAALRLPVLGRCGRLRDRKTSGRSARPRKHDIELRAIGRQTLRADCLGPPASFSLPAPGATSLRSNAPVRGLLHGRLRDRENQRTLRSPAHWCARQAA